MNNLTKVQKKNKNNKLSPFWCFVWEFKKKMESNGVRIHNDNQLREMASPQWNKLSAAEKERYKTKAKTSDKFPNKQYKTYNSIGQVIEEEDEKKASILDKDQLMVQEIQLMIKDANDHGELDSKMFIFISTSWFYSGGEGIFPAELALSKFSLKQGVFDHMQIRINPGELPLGSCRPAQEHSEKTHKYPLPPAGSEKGDYLTVLQEIMNFLHPFDKLPIFFAEGNMRDNKLQLLETRRVVEKILYESEEDDVMSTLKIYPIDELFFAMQRMTTMNKNTLNGTSDQPFPSISFAADKFNLDDFRFATKGCNYHDGEDVSHHCCLSKVFRYGFTIAKWCANGKRYELQEGQHYPKGYQPK